MKKGEETSPLRDGTGRDGGGAVSAPTWAAAGDVGKGEETSPLQDVRDGDGDGGDVVTAPTLGQILAYYKYQTTKQINQQRDLPGVPFWQRNYWEHSIRNDASLRRIREYIQNNPALWDQDQLHPDAQPNPFNQGRL